MTKAAHGRTKPAHGVMVASPAMAPTQRPTREGFPLRAHSRPTHTVRAVEAAISELTAACGVEGREEEGKWVREVEGRWRTQRALWMVRPATSLLQSKGVQDVSKACVA